MERLTPNRRKHKMSGLRLGANLGLDFGNLQGFGIRWKFVQPGGTVSLPSNRQGPGLIPF